MLLLWLQARFEGMQAKAAARAAAAAAANVQAHAHGVAINDQVSQGLEGLGL